MIRTVLRNLSPEQLGHAQCHEHIWLLKGASYLVNEALCMDDFDRSLRELQEYYWAGGRLIVDAQPAACGRSASALFALSEKSGVDIVAVTGFHKKEFFDDTALFSWTVDRLTDFYIREIRTGMTDPDGEMTPYRAGMLKVAAEKDWEQDSVYQKLFEAVAAAAAATRAPVMVHTEKGNDILYLISWFEKRGVPADKLMICHLDRTNYDWAYHLEVLATGCYLCYDSIHRTKYVSEQEELKLIWEMKKKDMLGQIMLSLDTTGQRLRAYQAKDMGLDYILKDYLPLLRKKGFLEKDIYRVCVGNAAKLLNF